MRELGLTRVVVPRELSVDEIRTFAKGTTVELEVFIHGALCVSWSGQCLTSEAWGGRSANRGQCAQSCRLPYDLIVDGEVRDLGDVKYLLSPQDLAGLDSVPALAAIGVASLKIEGRQKAPDYVATAVAGYRRWVDSLMTRRARSRAARARSWRPWRFAPRCLQPRLLARLPGRLPITSAWSRGASPSHRGRVPRPP